MNTGSLRITGLGAALPDQRVSNADLEAALGLPLGWFKQRTGIERRPVARPDQAVSDLAVAAGREALDRASINPAAIGLLLLATSTPDHLLPPTAPQVAHQLGLSAAGAVDVAGACAGFLYALVLAESYGRLYDQPVMVIAANVLSRRARRDDVNTVGLFADGAGAAILQSSGDHDDHGLLAAHLIADGSRSDDLWIPVGGSRTPATPQTVADGLHLMQMKNGKALYRDVVRLMAGAGQTALKKAGLDIEAVDWWIPHQASSRLISEVGRLLGVAPPQTVNVVDQIGNSSAATIPLALTHLDQAGRLQPGQLLLLTAVGAGKIAAGVVYRW